MILAALLGGYPKLPRAIPGIVIERHLGFWKAAAWRVL